MHKREHINGLLLLYHHPFVENASTIMEFVDAFSKYSQYKVWKVNTVMGFPEKLDELSFHGILLHYSLFGGRKYIPDNKFSEYIKSCQESYKVAFFQDEHHYCQQRFKFINEYKLDCVYTLLEPEFFADVYYKYTSVPKCVYHLPGYASEKMMAAGQAYGLEDSLRSIDIGYRGRRLEAYMGAGSQEKGEIAEYFARHADETGLSLNLGIHEKDRLYNEQWYKFLGNCKAVLGVEAGVSVFDLEDGVRNEYDRVMKSNPGADFFELGKDLLERWEDNIYYRTISPRHFEAAAFRNCQILFEGKYSGIMKPMNHYIPLKKDYSNFEEVIRLFKDAALRKELTDNAYRDLIESGHYSYQEFIKGFDRELNELNWESSVSHEQCARVEQILAENLIYRYLLGRVRAVKQYEFIGKDTLVRLYRKFISRDSD